MSLIKKWHFYPEFMEESSEETISPLRGWYSIFPFMIPEEPDFTELGYCLSESELLVLVQINIGRYKDGPLTQEAILLIEKILEFFENAGKNIILRFVYDSEGRGMENEPDNIALIETHISQLGDILIQYSKTIFLLQGIFVGSWGEMHNSRYLDMASVCRLLQALYVATKGSCRLSVRKPAYLRMIHQYAEEELSLSRTGELVSITGLYNDGMLASETDFGTYGMLSSDEEGVFLKEWERQEELDFQDKICRKVLNGGEVVNDNPYNEPEAAISDLYRMHVSYLNSQYDSKVLEKWKSAVYMGEDHLFKGKSVYEYIGAHLGYRYVLKKADVEKGKFLCLEIENRGFAEISETALSLELRTVSGEYVFDLTSSENETGIRSYRMDLKGIIPGEYKIYVVIKSVYYNTVLRFSNEGATDELFVGTLRKSF